MMALQILLLLEVIVILCSPTSSYPIYGTKRYGRSQVRIPYQMVRTQRYPLNYYELYPYSQTYPEEYYPQESYPVYYPPARTSKYEVYQAVLPYYYPRPGYGYYDNDPVVDLQEEMIQEAEREEREDSQPIGHELLYENEDQTDEDNFDDVNAAFLQNLIMSQMYKDSLLDNDEYYPSNEEYGRLEDSVTKQKSKSYSQEDEDVRELKQLAKMKGKPINEDIHWFQRSNFRNQKDLQSKNHYGEKRNNQDRKPIVKIPTTSTQIPTTPKRDSRGQKEEVLMRPATPVRRPFSSPVLEMMSKSDERKRAPSVYDTIKHMLDMEKNLENKYKSGVDEIRPQMKKRIITSEESLTQQLSVLKKAQ